MPRNLLLPLAAVVSFSVMVFHLTRTNQPLPPREPPVQPTTAPFSQVLAGAGLIEPRSENIQVGTLVSGIVVDVEVQVGQTVDAGQLLFRIDSRQKRADLDVQRAQLQAAQAELDRLQSLPRPEDIPPSQARVDRAQADLAAQEDQWNRADELVRRGISNQEDRVQRHQAYLSAKAQLAQAVAEHTKLLAGAWKAEIAVQAAQVEKAQQAVNQAQTEIERLEIRAPIHGQILKLNVRPGEYVGTPSSSTLVVIGDVSVLHVRVDIDEQDLPRFRPGLPGQGFVRGDGQHGLPLSFVRVEPYAEPKKSLTGNGNERVDTRVLQVIYQIDDRTVPVYVGQQLDVYLKLDPESGTVSQDRPREITSAIR